MIRRLSWSWRYRVRVGLMCAAVRQTEFDILWPILGVYGEDD
jgi:hypothetical protein